MVSPGESFLEQLRATFRGEADEHLQAMTDGLLVLEKGEPVQSAAVWEAMFRAAHSLKGAARAAEFPEVELECQGLEDLLASSRDGHAVATPGTLAQLHHLLQRLRALLASPPGGNAPALPDSSGARRPSPDSLSAAGHRHSGTGTVAPSVRLDADLLDSHMLQLEELLTARLAAGQRVEDLRHLTREVASMVRSFDTLPAAVAADPRSALRHCAQPLQRLHGQLPAFARSAERDREDVDKLVQEVLARARRLLAMPFSSICSGWAKLVGELALEQGKEAELVVRGEELEIDKRVLDLLKDPLLHLLRNCVAHGIEAPLQRVGCGKASRGRIELAVEALSGQRVQVTVSDDGVGMDLSAVKASAVDRGLLTPEAAARLSDVQAQSLVLRTGVSTSRHADLLSGRGLGLAIVQERVEVLGGELTILSSRGAGTTLRIVAPSVRATFRGVLVRCGGHELVLPTLQVERVARVSSKELRQLEGGLAVVIGGEPVPLVSLAALLEIPATQPGSPGRCQELVLIGRAAERIALAVDEVVDEGELLLRPLQPPLVRVRHIAAAVGLASGRLGLVLEIGDLLASARSNGSSRPSALIQAPVRPATRCILVAEDSITSRMLIKVALETAGYRVTTAFDGLDALAKLRSGRYDLLVSDVEMPRMNGFDLTARVRADRALSDLPVLLVSARESPQDLSRSVEVGASRYLAKSGFDPSVLIDAVGRLI